MWTTTGLLASEIALPGPGGASPQPSRMTSARRGTGISEGPGTRVIGREASARGRSDDRGEVRGVEARAPHQGAVHTGPPQQLGGVAGLDRASIEDPHP